VVRAGRVPDGYLARLSAHPVGLVTSFLFLLGAIAAEPRDSFYGCLLLIASYPIYRLARKNTVGIRPLDQPAVAEIE